MSSEKEKNFKKQDSEAGLIPRYCFACKNYKNFDVSCGIGKCKALKLVVIGMQYVPACEHYRHR